MSKLEFQEEWLSAYLDDELTEEQRQVVEQRLATDPAAQSLLEDLRRVRSMVAGLPTWNGAPIPFAIPEGVPGGDEDTAQDAGQDEHDDALDQDNFEAPIRAADLDLENRDSYRKLMTWIATAASILLVAGLGYLYWPSGSLMLSHADRSSTESAAPRFTPAPATEASPMDAPSDPNSETRGFEGSPKLGIETQTDRTQDAAGMAADKGMPGGAMPDDAMARGMPRQSDTTERMLTENAMRGLGGEMGTLGEAAFGAEKNASAGMAGMGAPAAPSNSDQLDVPSEPKANAPTANSEAAANDFAEALPPRSLSASDAMPLSENSRLNFSPNNNSTRSAPSIALPPGNANVEATPKAKASDPGNLVPPEARMETGQAMPPADARISGEKLQASPPASAQPENLFYSKENLGEPSQDAKQNQLQEMKNEQQLTAPVVWFARSANWMDDELQRSLPVANDYVGNALTIPESVNPSTNPSTRTAASQENPPPQPEVVIATVKATSSEAVPYFDALIASNQLTKLDGIANRPEASLRFGANQIAPEMLREQAAASPASIPALGNKSLQGNTLVLFVTRAEADQILSNLQQNEQIASQVWRVQQRKTTSVNPAWDYRLADSADAAGKQASDPLNQPSKDAASDSTVLPKAATNGLMDSAKPAQPSARPTAENDKVILLLNGLPQ